MKRGLVSTAIAGALAATMAAMPVAAEAQYRGDGYYRPAPVHDGWRGVHGDRAAGYDRGYAPRGYDGRYYRCRRDGSGGAMVGAIAGGLLGNAIAGYGDRAAGTVLGGVGGAFAGRAIDRDC